MRLEPIPRPEQPDPLRLGACMDLLPEVLDKYFFAAGNTEKFQSETARAICARCIVKVACLGKAIANTPPASGVVGGQTANTIAKLHRDAITGTPIQELIERALDNERPVKREYRHRVSRKEGDD